MSLTIKRTDSRELNNRKRELQESVDTLYGSSTSFAELKEMAMLGHLSVTELEIFDELRRIKFLLDE